MNAVTFNARRVARLIRHDLASRRKSLREGLLVISGVTLAGVLITAATGGPREIVTNLFANVLVIGGLVASSVTFNELQSEPTAVHYLTLPGSALEKYAAKLLLTSIGWTAAIMAVVGASSALGAGISALFFASNPGIVVPNTRAMWETVGGYLVAQPIFLFGSIYFRKNAFLKTTLSIRAAAGALALVWLVAARLLYAPAFRFIVDNWGVRRVILESIALTPRGESFAGALQVVGDALRWVVVPILFWTLGVLRLRETEV